MTPPSRSMMETSDSVVVKGSVASHRVSFGGEDGLAMMGLPAFTAAEVEEDENVNRFLKSENAILIVISFVFGRVVSRL